jgi:hypothetical protein
MRTGKEGPFPWAHAIDTPAVETGSSSITTNPVGGGAAEKRLRFLYDNAMTHKKNNTGSKDHSWVFPELAVLK